LAGGVRCEEGLLWLRRDIEEPSTSDPRALAEVLRSLLDIEEELASLRNVPMILSPDVREGILFLARAVGQSGRRTKTQR
jgi:hypothetical protein